METLQSTVYAFNEYLKQCRSTAYSEPVTKLHTAIAGAAWNRVGHLCNQRQGGRVVDLGCGSGFCLDLFRKGGYEPYAITCMKDEHGHVEELGYTAIYGDMHDIGAFENYFVGAWCRHVIEHSPAPGFLLHEIFKSLKPEGWMYLEVPAPGTACKHEYNDNHYSVMGADMWSQLLFRSGFEILDHMKIGFTTEAGKDEYFSWICRKPVINA